MDDIGEFDVLVNTTDLESEEAPTANFDVTSSITTVIIIVGVMTNSYVIWLLRSPTNHRVTSVYILNRCVADLLFLLTVPTLLVQIGLRKWIFGDVMCRLIMAQIHVCAYASNAFLLVMGVDSWWAVTLTGGENNTYRSRMMRILIAVIWLMAIILAVPFTVIFGTLKFVHDTTIHCMFLFQMNLIEVLQFLTISSCLGTLIVNWVMISLMGMPGSSLEQQMQPSREGIATQRVLMSFTLTFTVCQMPFIVTQVFMFVGHTLVPWGTLAAINSLVFLNAALNPAVYLVLMARLCRDRNLLLRRHCGVMDQSASIIPQDHPDILTDDRL
ncbi:somatostatin receptor type 3-like [Cherax quadricarinatus]|uniref:somatostatin receptor type 3-like n=1 Tax=Cherax quadricarinatus TaxID=27406 RepID=UPI0023791325|nr:somatostatin receptor type 3-like [Cherax quadricarinatus]